MIGVSDKLAMRTILTSSGDDSLDEAAFNLLRSLQDIADDQSDGEQSRLQSPLVCSSRYDAMSPGTSACSSFRGTPVHAGNRNRMRSGGQGRMLQNSASTPTLMHRSGDPAVCRGSPNGRGSRGERFRNAGQSVLLQDFSVQHGRQSPMASPLSSTDELCRTPIGGSSNFSTFRSNYRDSRPTTGENDPWECQRRGDPLQNRDRPQQNRNRDRQQPSRSCGSPAHKEHRPIHREARHQPHATGATTSGSNPAMQGTASSAEERRAKDELEHLRQKHMKTTEELGQATRQLAAAQVELRKRAPKQQFEEELMALRSQLNEVKAERDQHKAELQLARQQSLNAARSEDELTKVQTQLAQARGERDQLRNDLQLARATAAEAQQQLPAKDALLQNLQEELQHSKPEGMALQKAVSGYSAFLNRIINTSARPVLNDVLDMKDAELLGMGHYGYIMSCKSRESNDKVVLKLQSLRCADVAVREWAHGEEVGKHPNIMELKELFVHSDSDQTMEDCLVARYKSASEVLLGKRPKWSSNAYICMVSEYMDYGSVSSFLEKKLLTLEGVCAVTRQVASALAFMHQQERNHNDIKPSNILLKRAPHGDILQVKLADVGSAEHSVDHARDRELLAHTIWCMVVGRDSSPCPSEDDDKQEAMAELMKAPLLGRRATSRGTALIETVVGLWEEQLDVASAVARNAEFEGCEVREPEAAEMRRQLTACANSEVTKRAGALLERFQHSGHSATLANVDFDDVDAIQTALASLDEGSIPVLDSRDD